MPRPRKPVSREDELRDVAVLMARYKGEQCPKGHEINADNIYRRTVASKPVVECKACHEVYRQRTLANKKRQKFTPNPLDSAVQTAREERARVLHMRAKYGNEWWRKVA